MTWLSRGIAKLGTRDAMNMSFPETLSCDTPDCAIAWAGGRTAYKAMTHTCGSNEDDKTHNMFTITGAVKILAIWCYITEATEVTDFEAFKLQLYDGTNTIDLCAASNLDGIPVGSLLERDEDGDALTELDGSQVRYDEVTSRQRVFTEGTVLQKYNTTTYIRSIFNGNNVDCDMLWVVRWSPMTPPSKVEAV